MLCTVTSKQVEESQAEMINFAHSNHDSLDVIMVARYTIKGCRDTSVITIPV